MFDGNKIGIFLEMRRREGMIFAKILKFNLEMFKIVDICNERVVKSKPLVVQNGILYFIILSKRVLCQCNAGQGSEPQILALHCAYFNITIFYKARILFRSLKVYIKINLLRSRPFLNKIILHHVVKKFSVLRPTELSFNHRILVLIVSQMNPPNTNGRYHLSDLGIGERIILKWTLQK
jgi:hypothetical protein